MTQETPGRAGKKEWVGLAVIALPCLIYSMDLTVLNLALPHISADLQPSSSELLWIIDIYGFMVASMLIPMGTLGDRIGRRKMLLIGAGIFGVTSVIAAFSFTSHMLILSRALLGIGGATLAPSTLSLIRNMFLDDNQRRFAIGVWVASFSIGGAIGPLIGGVMLEHFQWGSVFLLAVPIMVMLLIMGPIFLPEYKDPDPGKVDILSPLLSLIAVLLMIFGLKKLAEDGFHLLPVFTILMGLLVSFVFVQRQLRLKDPLIDLKLFTLPAFSTALSIYMLAGFISFGIFVFVYQYLQLVLGLSPLETGLWSMPSFIGFIVGTMFVPTLCRYIRPAYVIACSLLLAAIGFGILSQVNAHTGIYLLISANFLFSLGLSPVFTLATDIVIGSAPPERAGAASAISETSSEFGGALGIAILGSIGTFIYRTRMHDIIPDSVGPTLKEMARETLPGAVTVAGQIDHQLAAPLLNSAREAFVIGMQITALTGVVIVIGMIFLSIRNLKHIPASKESN